MASSLATVARATGRDGLWLALCILLQGGVPRHVEHASKQETRQGGQDLNDSEVRCPETFCWQVMVRPGMKRFRSLETKCLSMGPISRGLESEESWTSVCKWSLEVVHGDARGSLELA